MRWTRPCEDWDVEYYDIIVRNTKSGEMVLTQEYECQEPVCVHELIGGFKSCVEYSVSVTAHEEDGSEVAVYSLQTFSTLDDGNPEHLILEFRSQLTHHSRPYTGCFMTERTFQMRIS